MGLRLGQRVVIVSDSLEQHLPVGDHAYVIAFERNGDTVFDFVIRIPRWNKNVGVPKADIEAEEVFIHREVDRLTDEALIDFALSTRNEELFRYLIGADEPETGVNSHPDQQSQDEFIRQVNLKAWI